MADPAVEPGTTSMPVVVPDFPGFTTPERVVPPRAVISEPESAQSPSDVTSHPPPSAPLEVTLEAQESQPAPLKVSSSHWFRVPDAWKVEKREQGWVAFRPSPDGTLVEYTGTPVVWGTNETGTGFFFKPPSQDAPGPAFPPHSAIAAALVGLAACAVRPQDAITSSKSASSSSLSSLSPFSPAVLKSISLCHKWWEKNANSSSSMSPPVVPAPALKLLLQAHTDVFNFLSAPSLADSPPEAGLRKISPALAKDDLKYRSQILPGFSAAAVLSDLLASLSALSSAESVSANNAADIIKHVSTIVEGSLAILAPSLATGLSKAMSARLRCRRDASKKLPAHSTGKLLVDTPLSASLFPAGSVGSTLASVPPTVVVHVPAQKHHKHRSRRPSFTPNKSRSSHFSRGGQFSRGGHSRDPAPRSHQQAPPLSDRPQGQLQDASSSSCRGCHRRQL